MLCPAAEVLSYPQTTTGRTSLSIIHYLYKRSYYPIELRDAGLLLVAFGFPFLPLIIARHGFIGM